MKTRFFKRISVLAMATFLSMASMPMTNVLACEEPKSVAESEVMVENEAITRSVGDLLYSSSASIQNVATVTITTTEGNWDANFYVGVLGNAGKTYTVQMYKDGVLMSDYIAMVVGNDSSFKNIANLTYAPPATYKFVFRSYDTVTTTGTAMVWIYD